MKAKKKVKVLPSFTMTEAAAKPIIDHLCAQLEELRGAPKHRVKYDAVVELVRVLGPEGEDMAMEYETRYTVSVTYDGFDREFDERLGNVMGVEDSDGSGFGFGQRDVQWSWKNKKKRDDAFKAAKAWIAKKRKTKSGRQYLPSHIDLTKYE